MSEAVSCDSSTERFRSWEFWPAWLFYSPILPWIGWQALRYGGLKVWTAANPGVPGPGLIEPKDAILSQLAPEFVAPTAVSPVESSPFEDVRDWADRTIASRGWRYPLVLKPNEAERGEGMRVARAFSDVEAYIKTTPGRFLIQPYHAGPFEAGIFFYRMPGETSGRIFSITDKQFPILEGDGCSTLEQLIRRHPRYRKQARRFLKRHAARASEIPSRGERISLAIAGNHCQGTIFRDGERFWSPALEQAINSIVRPFDGFCFGRFDVRYSDPQELRAGRGFVVIELNGVLSESTNIYDPSWTLREAYRVLSRQWELAFRIGAANRARGARTATWRELACDWLKLRRRSRERDPISD